MPVSKDVHILTKQDLSEIKRKSYLDGVASVTSELGRLKANRRLAMVSEIAQVKKFLTGGYDQDIIDAVCHNALLALKLLREKDTTHDDD